MHISNQKSIELGERARRVIWKGGKESTQHEALRSCGYPRFMSHGAGCQTWDVDGNCYVDYLMSWGTVLLGHAFPAVERAVSQQLAKGSLLDLAVEQEVRLAERLVQHIPGAELVRFLATGSDATQAAVRIARGATERAKIVQYGFHGWLDWCQSAHPAGIMPSVLANTIGVKFNDIDDLKKVFADYRNEIACVILEPVKDEEPAAGYLQAVRDIAHENGALLVFDEAKTGFRFGLGGAQGHYGVTSDLCVFSKALANGYPLAVVTGKAEVFERANDVWVSGTYHGWPPAITAAEATLTVLENEPVAPSIWKLGSRLMEGVNTIMSSCGFRARLQGAAAMPKLAYSEQETPTIRRFFAKMVGRGYFIHPTHPWFISYAHNEACIDTTLENIDAAIREVVAG